MREIVSVICILFFTKIVHCQHLMLVLTIIILQGLIDLTHPGHQCKAKISITLSTNRYSVLKWTMRESSPSKRCSDRNNYFLAYALLVTTQLMHTHTLSSVSLEASVEKQEVLPRYFHVLSLAKLLRETPSQGDLLALSVRV